MFNFSNSFSEDTDSDSSSSVGRFGFFKPADLPPHIQLERLMNKIQNMDEYWRGIFFKQIIQIIRQFPELVNFVAKEVNANPIELARQLRRSDAIKELRSIGGTERFPSYEPDESLRETNIPTPRPGM